MKVQDVDLAKITVEHNRRPVKQATVKALADSILAIGLQHPIGLLAADGRFRLLHGRHRLEAYRSLEWLKIPAVVFTLDALHAELAEIDENIVRKDLTAIEHAKAMKRRKEIYEALWPGTKAHVAGGKAGGRGRRKIANAKSAPATFTEDTAAKTGQSQRTIQEDVALGEAVCDEAAELIADTPAADNKSELKALAELEEAQQVAVANELKAGKRQSVRDEPQEPSFCRDLDALVEKHHKKHRTPWCIIRSVLDHKLEWAKEQQD